MINTTVEQTIDSYIEPDTQWNADAKKAWANGDLGKVLDIIGSYYQFVYHTDAENL